VEKRSLEKYQGLLNHLENFFKQQLVDSITTAKAAAFVEWLAKKLQPITMRERLVMLKSCWDWGISKQLAVENP